MRGWWRSRRIFAEAAHRVHTTAEGGTGNLGQFSIRMLYLYA